MGILANLEVPANVPLLTIRLRKSNYKSLARASMGEDSPRLYGGEIFEIF
jgi:hypothetical protein